VRSCPRQSIENEVLHLLLVKNGVAVSPVCAHLVCTSFMALAVADEMVVADGAFPRWKRNRHTQTLARRPWGRRWQRPKWRRTLLALARCHLPRVRSWQDQSATSFCSRIRECMVHSIVHHCLSFARVEWVPNHFRHNLHSVWNSLANCDSCSPARSDFPPDC
jgi:hypothetical protein